MKHDARRRSQLRIETLEDRATPAVWNNPWPEPGRLTLSFAPDGTRYADGTPSALFATLGQQMTTAEWQGEFLRAAQQWAAVAGINISVVADSGKPFDQAGPIQGSADYGDIRVGAKPLADSSLIVTTPFDLLGAGAGDVVVNVGKAFGRGGAGGAVDLYTAALQEVGHALGVPNSPDPASAMYTVYGAPRAGLAAGDVASIQSLYGARPADRFEGDSGNNSADKADEVKFVSGVAQFGDADPTAGGTPYVAAGDVTTAGDVDYFKVKLPSSATDFFVQLRTTGVSDLVARVTVTTDKGVVVQSAAAADPRTGDLAVYVGNARPGGTYLVRVEAAGGPFAVGAYRLAAGTAAADAVFPEARTGWQSPDGNRNDTFAARKDLGGVKLAAGAAWEFTGRMSVENAADRDFYKVKVDKGFTAGVVVVSVWATEADRLDPVVRVYDKNGVRVAADVLGSDRSTYTLQLTGVAPDSELTVEVAAADPSDAARNTGNYFLGIDLRAAPVVLASVSSGTLTAAGKQWAGQMAIDLPRTYHFNLTLGSAPVAAGAAARVTVYDAAGRVVASFMAQAGDAVGTDVSLLPGLYTIKVAAGTKSGAVLPNLGYSLRMAVRDDPIGPRPVDPTSTPVAPPTNPPPPPVSVAPTTWAYWADDYSDPWFGV